jgi:hypothetical protein
MTIVEDEARLKALEESEERLTRETSSLSDVFADAAARWVAEAIGVRVRAVSEQQHAHTLSLREEGRLADMKAEVAAAQDAAPDRAKAALASLPWEFRRSIDDGDRSNYTSNYSPLQLMNSYPKSPPTSVTQALSPVAGIAHTLLEGYGFAETGGWRRGTKHSHDPGLNDEAYAALERAAESDTKVLKLRRDIRALRTAIGEAKAKVAWDDA